VSSDASIPEHGTRARYQGSRTRPPCHCDECTEANRQYGREYHDRTEPTPVAKHGTRSGYNKGCRTVADCPSEYSCVQANRDYQKEWARVNIGGHLWDQPRKYVRKKPLDPPQEQETQT